MNEPRDDGRVCEEEDPDPVPALTVCGDDFVLVGDPVLVPAVDGSGVVYTKDVDVLNFKSVGFDLVNDPSEGAGGVGTREDVFVHEESP